MSLSADITLMIPVPRARKTLHCGPRSFERYCKNLGVPIIQLSQKKRLIRKEDFDRLIERATKRLEN